MTKSIQPFNLSTLHSFQLPTYAKQIDVLGNLKQISQVSNEAYVLGAGSNTLFIDDIEFPLLLVRTKGIQVKELPDSWQVTVAAGEDWHHLVLSLHRKGIHGLENLALIPGTVGAAPVQNIGAYGVEVSEFISTVRAWDRQLKYFLDFSNSDCEFSYRDSFFKRQVGRWLITEVCFNFPKNWQAITNYGELHTLSQPVSAADVLNKVIQIRTSKLPDPKVTPNAGSFFKNPVVSKALLSDLLKRHSNLPHYETAAGDFKIAAGWLIDQLNLKGTTVGDAAVHDRQALVLVNLGHALGRDVIALARLVREKVQCEFGIQLEAEVRLLGGKGTVEL